MHSVIKRTTLLALVTLLVTAAPAAANTLVISGAGDGHGVGMSQDGALGFAQHGWPYRAILAHYYQHTEIGQAPPHTVVRVLEGNKVKRVPLEAYVRGVVSAEVSASWPTAALQAQAVASRTYAITAHAGGSRFDVYADTRSQMYLGKAAETPSTNAAVASTAGQVVTYAGQPAITYFYADSGGHTESVQYGFPGSTPEPWLVGVSDPYDNGPASKWTVSMSFAAAARRLRGLIGGSFRGIEVTKRGSSPRIVSAYVLGTKGRTAVSGPELAGRLGLNATWAYFSVRDSHGTHAEPDVSGKTPAKAPAPATPASAVTAAGGSATAPAAPEATAVSGVGGVSAG
ncbi:MAG TPA: SpoIID/LytB domain-containing protein [Solirubrobacteraceae bacterium]|nr:SpoIID/LytB domain-containing protein [Solirubrobacteraceae bacterium]